MKFTKKRNFTINCITSALLLCCATESYGQAVDSNQATEQDVETIEVRGIRGSLENAAARKRDSNRFIDAIVAEDIGKLPDTNVAESLQRVSGVQIQRTAGEGSSVAIRGIRENRIEINGRTYVSPYGRGVDDSTSGGGNQDVLRFLPAELIKALVVTKQLTADQIDGSLGGTIDVQTRKPLDNPGFQAAAGIDLTYDELGEDSTGKLSFLVSNSFMNDTLGVQLSGVRSNRNTTEDKFWNFGGWVPMTGVDPNNDGIDAYRMSDLRYQQSRDEREDLALNLVTEFIPSNSSKLYFELFYTDSDNQNDRDWLSVPTSGSLDAYNGTAIFSENDSLVAGTLAAPIQGNAVHARFESQTTQLAIGGEFSLSDVLDLELELAHSKAELEEDQQFLRAQTIENYDVQFDFRGGDFASLELPTDVNELDPSLYVYNVGFDRIFMFENQENSARADFDYLIGGDVFDSVEFGVRWADMSFSKDYYEQVFRPGINAADPSVTGLALTIDQSGILAGANNVSFPGEFLAPDTSLGRGFCKQYQPDCPGPVLSDPLSYSVDDTIFSAYAKVNFYGDMGQIPFSGNVGVRYSETETTVNNVATVRADSGTEFVPQSIENTYSDALPSAMLKMELTPDLFLRFGYSEVVARPSSRDLAVALDVDPKENAATAGNPNLEPFRANQFDVSLEWYGEDQTSVTAGLFFKDVDSFIVTETSQEVLPGFGDTPYLVQRQFNGTGGEVQGLELSYQQPFTFLPGPFDGFGTLINYSYIDSSTDLVNSRTGKELPLIGLSENNFNIVAYFENETISARLAYNWRDEYVDGIGAGGAAIFVDDFASLDASFRYNISEKLAVDFEAVNLLNSPVDQYVGTKETQWVWAETGVRFTVGLSYTF